MASYHNQRKRVFSGHHAGGSLQALANTGPRLNNERDTKDFSAEIGKSGGLRAKESMGRKLYFNS